MNQNPPHSALRASDDLRVDYALIGASVAAGLIALIYLILI
jgi:hypothetical protein